MRGTYEGTGAGLAMEPHTLDGFTWAVGMFLGTLAQTGGLRPRSPDPTGGQGIHAPGGSVLVLSRDRGVDLWPREKGPEGPSIPSLR